MDATTGTVIAPDGTGLFTRTWIPEDSKANVLLVHGLGDHCGRWDHVGRFLADRGYAVTAFDLRGHGESEGRRGHVDTFDDFVSDVAHVAGEAGLFDDSMPWVLYGHSLGGLIATRYLLSDYPQPDVAVLSSPALDADVPQILRTASSVLGRMVPTLSMPNSITGDQLSRDPDVGETYVADPLVHSKATTGFGHTSLAAQAEALDNLDKIRVPTLVFHGADDLLVPPSASAPLAAVDSVERRVYPGLRHETHNEPEADQVLADVADWLDSAFM